MKYLFVGRFDAKPTKTTCYINNFAVMTENHYATEQRQ